jgi:hypothetical protein
MLALAALCAILTAPASAQLDAAMRARIEAIAPIGPDIEITEALLRRGDASGQKAALAAAAAIATRYLDASVRAVPTDEARLGIEGANCFDAAPKLGLMLRAKGFPVSTVGAGSHVYLVASFPRGMLVVDPTIRQYFGAAGSPSWVPKIFVGTVSDLAALYAREPARPVLPYRDIYFPEFGARRKDGKIFSRRSSYLSSPSSQEHAPLTAYFNAEAGRRRLQKFEKTTLPALSRDPGAPLSLAPR